MQSSVYHHTITLHSVRGEKRKRGRGGISGDAPGSNEAGMGRRARGGGAGPDAAAVLHTRRR